MTFIMPVMMLIMNATSVAIVWFGGNAIDNGTLQTGDLIAFITYAMVIIMGFLMIGMISIMLPRASVAADRVNEVINCKPSITDPSPNDQTKAAKAKLEATSQSKKGAEIRFEGVRFKYPESDEYVLRDIDFVA